jgi:hypothetical protein
MPGTREQGSDFLWEMITTFRMALESSPLVQCLSAGIYSKVRGRNVKLAGLLHISYSLKIRVNVSTLPRISTST